MRGRQGQQPSRQGACCWRRSVKMQGRVGARASGALLLQVLQPHRQDAGKGFEHARRMGVRAGREVVLMRDGRRQVLKPRRQGARGFTHAGKRASRGTRGKWTGKHRTDTNEQRQTLCELAKALSLCEVTKSAVPDTCCAAHPELVLWVPLPPEGTAGVRCGRDTAHGRQYTTPQQRSGRPAGGPGGGYGGSCWEPGHQRRLCVHARGRRRGAGPAERGGEVSGRSHRAV